MIVEKFKLNKDFRRLYGRGKSFVSPHVVTYCICGKQEKIRVGITVAKKIGNAVCRNRAKRLITAAFREVQGQVKQGAEIVFVARTRILYTKSTTVAKEIKEHLLSAGALKTE